MRDDGGSAFPIGGFDGVEFHTREPGMSLREWFAGQALIARADFYAAGSESEVAADCVRLADAMLVELAKS